MSSAKATSSAANATAATQLVPVQLPARTIPPPPTISEAARMALSTGAATPPVARPAADDLEGWRRAIEASERMWEPIAAQMLSECRCEVETRSIAGVTTYVCTPDTVSAAAEGRVYLYFHGGAFVFGAGRFAMATGAASAERLGITTYSVDYRMPPDHPFPAAPEDCLAVYRALIDRHGPRRIVIGGSSAGGNLAAAVTLMVRDRGLPLPAAVVLLTPEVDLTEAGDTFRTNALLDVTLKGGLPECNALYAAGRDLTDPYLSPLYADFARGFPPTLIQSGTRDLFLSNSVLLHRKLRAAGLETELHVWEAMPHGGFGFGPVPENEEISAEVARFIGRHA
ncbi:MAG TPA: alpha/beta hydrolase [Steroidobacteraceae bacterium]|nr:alpha/beta hydrolase [Steroidobacteraceae bacterium]